MTDTTTNSSEKLLKRTSKSWVSESMVKYFQEIGFEDLLEDGLQLIKNRRVLDFSVGKGVFSARVFGETGAPALVSVSLPVSYTHLTLPTICSV